MGVPCVNDTCSISSSVDGAGKLNLNTNIDADGGLVCTAGQGVGVNIDTNPCNKLSSSVFGLLASPPNFELIELGGTKVAFAANGTNTSLSLNKTITNNSSACQRLLIANFRWQFNYTTNNAAADYESDGTFLVHIARSLNVGDPIDIADSFAIAGPDVNGNSDLHVIVHDATIFIPIDPGEVLTITGRGIRDADGTSVDGTGGSNGLTVSAKGVVIEATASDLVTVA